MCVKESAGRTRAHSVWWNAMGVKYPHEEGERKKATEKESTQRSTANSFSQDSVSSAHNDQSDTNASTHGSPRGSPRGSTLVCVLSDGYKKSFSSVKNRLRHMKGNKDAWS